MGAFLFCLHSAVLRLDDKLAIVTTHTGDNTTENKDVYNTCPSKRPFVEQPHVLSDHF